MHQAGSRSSINILAALGLLCLSATALAQEGDACWRDPKLQLADYHRIYSDHLRLSDRNIGCRLRGARFL